MREIKFRFWDNVINNMYYGEEVSKSKNELRHNWYCITKEEGLMVGNVGPSGMDNYDLIVMQYTGLKDKNNKEIYEGDILQIEIKDKTIKDKIIVSDNTVVEYKNCKFGVVWGWHRDFICLDGFYNTDFKIKGNIYGNPELLEG
ncbi:YopX family protein [Clostridium sporogenes]|uniref:YopX family protein n=1 Tax=Clostridium sporogenes TaxID=1509 RepID=UPI0022372202|nr:YopX family protein [Clostridium sporogenes]MCW6112179.1 YopX family protein [Clostridium sporogenes]